MPNEMNPDQRPEIVHRCPPEDSSVMPCCELTPFEVPRYHRLTVDDSFVTCTTRPAKES